MKAIQYTAFGSSSVLAENDVEKPILKDNEVLVKVLATTVNPFDMKVREGFMQKAMPIQLPYIPGRDVAGIVDAVGANVSRVKLGDAVYATVYGGTYAEYVAISEAQAALQPSNLSPNEAAALAVPLTTAYTLLVETANLQPGEKILIHGAAGGVGSTMVQLAKLLGAYVIGTAATQQLVRLQALGADEVIDYKTQDFTQLVKGVDIVADLIGGETQTKSFDVLKKNGRLVSLVSPPSATLATQFGVSATFVSSNPSHKKLDFSKQWVEEGAITPQVAATFKLSEAAAAQDLVSKGGVNGKVVLEVG